MSDLPPSDPMARRVALASLLGGLTVASYLVLEPFLVSLTWAAILAYISWPLYRRLRRVLRGQATVSALIMTLLLVTALVLPAFWLTGLLAEEIGVAYRETATRLAAGPPSLPGFVANLPWVGDWLRDLLARVAGEPAQLRTELGYWAGRFSGELAQIAGGVGRNLLRLSLALLVVFFFYRDGEQLIDQLRRVLRRFLGERVLGYSEAVGATVKAVMYGLLLTALAQGGLAGIGYWFAGIGAPIMLGAVTALVALLPFGTPLVWGSLGLWLLLTGHLWAGVGLLAWGTLVVSSIDNLIRPLVISSATQVPFLLVLLGVLGGAAAFGLVGLILGPVILGVLSAVWREALERERQNRTSKPPAGP
jgi:predicted PurR-regulated permease PerM